MRKTGLFIDSKNNRVFWDGKQVHLAKLPFRFLELCYIWRGRRVSRGTLMDYVYYDRHPDDAPFEKQLFEMAWRIRMIFPGIHLRTVLNGFTLD